MKNAKAYEPKIRKLMAEARGFEPPLGDDDRDPLRVLVRGVLSANATPKQADEAVEAIEGEFVDFNELRVSPVKDLTDRLGREHPRRRAKAEMLTGALNAVFERTGSISMDYMARMPKRDLRRHLREIGLDPYAAAFVAMFAFGGHAVCVDEDLAEALKMDDLVSAESDVEDIQGFLERVVPQKDAEKAHAYFRDLVRRKMPALTRQRREQAEARAKAEAEAEKKRAEAEQAAAEKKASREKAARKKAAKKAATKSKSAKKKKAAARKKAAKKKTAAGAKKKPKKKAKKQTGKTKKTAAGSKKKSAKKKTATRKKTTGKKTSAAGSGSRSKSSGRKAGAKSKKSDKSKKSRKE